ncbi:SAM-dependent DNA methyltransferase [Candidatus Geothermarchaeota archaeon]|nr:MAG: SAM-dependent DNA methyltransferase [Candidatus Geothermarchaeota archaeon]
MVLAGILMEPQIPWDRVSGLEDWVKRRYLVLLREFGGRSFTAEDVEDALERMHLGVENVGKLLSALMKAGLVVARSDPRDARRRIYSFIMTLKLPFVRRGPGRDELIRLLKSGADLIRTAVDYKVLLLFLFYKVVSDKWNRIVEGYRREGFPEREAYVLANSDYINLYDEKEDRLYTWDEVTKSRETVKEIANAIIMISRMNPKLERLQKLVEVLGFLGFISEENMHILDGLVQLFNTYDFADVGYDVIGDAYQWVLLYFAPEKAKEGEIYTPRDVIKLIVELLGPEDGSVILDPACGSGAMLIEAYNYVMERLGKEPSIELVGKERNEIIAVIANMNLILHGIADYTIHVGDSLLYPNFGMADYVIANPPWNQDGYSEENLGEPRIREIYTTFVEDGFTPRSSADWAWVQLMLYHARRKVGIVLDQGALFRSGREGRIRRGLVEKDLIEAIVLLPEKLFYNTGAPGIVMVLNRNKPEERRGKILFINASEEFEKHPEIRRLNRLGEEHIRKIVEAYRRFENVEGFARVVPLSEIREKDYNLNVTLYVFPREEEEEIDLAKELEELREIELREKEAIERALGYVREILEVMRSG